MFSRVLLISSLTLEVGLSTRERYQGLLRVSWARAERQRGGDKQGSHPITGTNKTQLTARLPSALTKSPLVYLAASSNFQLSRWMRKASLGGLTPS